MKLFKKSSLLILFVFFLINSFAQDTTTANENGFMYENGKIYVVMAVVVIILIGLFLYMVNLDRKISKLEKKDKS